MFCPVCRSEYREGFARCSACDADLVPTLAPGGDVPARAAVAAVLGRMLDYCGFVALADARGARDTLRHEGVASEIAIRDAPGTDGEEEYWLRVPAESFSAVAAILGYDAAGDAADSGVERCSECGAGLPEDAAVCPGCGARFEGA